MATALHVAFRRFPRFAFSLRAIPEFCATEENRGKWIHRDLQFTIIVVVLFGMRLCSSSSAAIQGFAESFDGTGPYQTIDARFDGLDNLGWDIDGDGTLEGGGYVVTNIDPDPSGETGGVHDYISREVFGRGSFVSQVEINGAFLGAILQSPDTSQGLILLEQALVPGVDRLYIALREVDDSVAEDGIWGLTLLFGNPNDLFVDLVPAGQDIVLSIAYDDTTSKVTFGYDPDVNDAQAGISYGPIEYAGEFAETTTARLSFIAVAGGRADGIVDSWSLSPSLGIPGDFNHNNVLDAADIDLLSSEVRKGRNTASYDLNADTLVNAVDRQIWVHDLKRTYFGDADLNGVFDSTDLVQVLGFGEYEDNVPMKST